MNSILIVFQNLESLYLILNAFFYALQKRSEDQDLERMASFTFSKETAEEITALLAQRKH